MGCEVLILDPRYRPGALGGLDMSAGQDKKQSPQDDKTRQQEQRDQNPSQQRDDDRSKEQGGQKGHQERQQRDQRS